MLNFSSSKKVLSTAAACMAASALLSFSPLSHAAEEPFTAEQKKAIETMVHEYIVSHPEVLVEAAQALESRKMASQEQALDAAITHFRNDKNTPVRGDRKSPHYLIEFFDYNCGYCKVVRPFTKKLQEKYKVAIHYVELPILSPMSMRASAIGLALYKQDPEKYLIYQDELMNPKSRITSEDQLKAAVKKAGADYDKINAIATDDPAVGDTLRKNMEISQQIGLQGTPFFILDGKVIRGAVKDFSVFEDIIKQAEKEAKSK